MKRMQVQNKIKDRLEIEMNMDKLYQSSNQSINQNLFNAPSRSLLRGARDSG